MPVMDGIKATKKMRAYLTSKGILDQPAIVGVTGHTLKEFQAEGIKAGMTEIVPKPMYIRILKEKLIKY